MWFLKSSLVSCFTLIDQGPRVILLYSCSLPFCENFLLLSMQKLYWTKLHRQGYCNRGESGERSELCELSSTETTAVRVFTHQVERENTEHPCLLISFTQSGRNLSCIFVRRCGFKTWSTMSTAGRLAPSHGITVMGVISPEAYISKRWFPVLEKNIMGLKLSRGF